MYPYGSGQPNQPNQQQHRAPFGVGFIPNQSPYPANNSSPYPANNSSPYPANNSTPYPSSGGYPHSSNQPNQAPYPSAHGAPYPTAHSQCPYPSTQNAPYPSAQNSPYPGVNNSPYPVASQYPFGAAVGSNQWNQAQSSYPCSENPITRHQSPYTTSSQPAGYPSNNSYPSSANPSYPSNNIAQGSPQNTNYGSNNMAPSNTSFQSSVKKGTPTVTPDPNFDANKDAHALRKAMKGFGTDEDALINVICRRSNEQRQEIQRQYKTHFGKDLIEDIKSETSGNFENLLVGLLRPIVDFYCTELCTAMAGIGTDEEVLIEILCTLSNTEIHIIKNAYLRMYGAHLESELKSETSGNFKRLLVSLCCAARDESGRVDPVAAQHDARELLNAGELRVGTDESMFNMVLCQRNYQQLKMILDEYANITGHSLEKAIKREFSGDIQEGLLAICKCVTNKSEYFASRLHKSMAGIGTNDQQLIRVIVTRCEIDMQDIKGTFERVYGKSLKSWIKGDTSGHYKHALYALIGEERSS